jgi:hypothetical protein
MSSVEWTILCLAGALLISKLTPPSLWTVDSWMDYASSKC